MIPTPLSPTPPVQQQKAPVFPLGDPGSLTWIDQFNENLLLTIQALHQLHMAFDHKFTGGHPDF